MILARKKPEKIVNTIETWLKSKIVNAGASGGIVGLSGGIDSAVVAVLLKRIFNDKMLGIKMPCHSSSTDEDHADILIEKFQIPSQRVDLTDTYDVLIKSCSGDFSDMACANTKARLRMTTLYLYGQTNDYLVCGTGNASELTVGYFTKYGDSGSDLLPLAELTKTEVREVARYLGVPDEIIDKAPSAGLWEGQTDEDEMGLYYNDIDEYIVTGHSNDEEEISRRFKLSEHKRRMPAICHIF